VRGTVEGVPVFRGVPFARPPLADLRFAPPGPWDGARDALAFGPPPPQAGAFGMDARAGGEDPRLPRPGRAARLRQPDLRSARHADRRPRRRRGGVGPHAGRLDRVRHQR